MKNGHDKIDDVFRERIGNMESSLPDSFFEETWNKAQAGKTAISGSGWTWQFYVLIPAILIATGVIAFLTIPTAADESGIIASSEKHDYHSTRPSFAANNPTKTIAESTVRNTTEITAPEMQNGKINADIAENKTEISYHQPILKAIPTEKDIENNSSEKYMPTGSNGLASEKITSNEANRTKQKSDPTDEVKQAPAGLSFSFMAPLKPDISNSILSYNLPDYNPQEFPEKKIHRWSAEASMIVSSTYTRLRSLLPETSTLVNARNDALSSSVSSYSGSLLFSFHYNTWLFSGGLSWQSFTEQTDYGMVLTNPQQSYHYYYNGSPYTYIENNNYYLVDSTSFWHYTYVVDSMWHVSDSILGFEIDTTLVNATDSSLLTRFDTADYSRLKASYSLFEIPLYAGFEICRGKWGYGFRGGVIPGILIRQQGSLFDGSQEVYLPSDIFPARKFILSAGVAGYLNFYPSEKMNLFAGPEIKATIINIAKTGSGIHQQWISTGVRGGIRYFF